MGKAHFSLLRLSKCVVFLSLVRRSLRILYQRLTDFFSSSLKPSIVRSWMVEWESSSSWYLSYVVSVEKSKRFSFIPLVKIKMYEQTGISTTFGHSAALLVRRNKADLNKKLLLHIECTVYIRAFTCINHRNGGKEEPSLFLRTNLNATPCHAMLCYAMLRYACC